MDPLFFMIAWNQTMPGQAEYLNCTWIFSLLLKYNGLLAMHQDPALDMVLQRSGKNESLEITSFLFQLLKTILVRYFYNILFYDRPFVEILGYIMTGRSDYFYAAHISLPVWITSDESRQE